MLIDQWIEAHTGKAFDKGGRTAAGGSVVASLVTRYMESPFFSANIRRSLDRSDFVPPQRARFRWRTAHARCRI